MQTCVAATNLYVSDLCRLHFLIHRLIISSIRKAIHAPPPHPRTRRVGGRGMAPGRCERNTRSMICKLDYFSASPAYRCWSLILRCQSGTNTLPENNVKTPDVAQPSIVGRQCTVTLTWSHRELKCGRAASKRSISSVDNLSHRVSPTIFRHICRTNPTADPRPIQRRADV